MSYKASIILACYNKEKFLDRSLNSLINLSRFAEFEIIIVDDKSKDKSTEIIKRYVDKYSNIKLIELEIGSGGASRPRNIGIEASTTDYLIFMDPDDEVINDGYSLLLTKMEELKSDIIIAARQGIDEFGNLIWVDYIDYFPYENINNERIQKDILNRRPFILKTIYSKKMIMDNNIRFPENIRTSEDEVFDMHCVSCAKKITKINDIVYKYTVEATGSITTNVSMAIYHDMYDVLNELDKVYSQMFEEKVVINRIVALMNAFYIKKLTFLTAYNDIVEACDIIYYACEKFGFNRLDKVSTFNLKRVVDSIKSQSFIYITVRPLVSQLKINKKENKKLKKDLDSLNNRKLVKIAKALTRARKSKPSKEKKDQKEIEIEQKKYSELLEIESVRNGYWVFADREQKGQDNAEALYQYVMENNIHDKIAFIISPKARDYNRLKNEGFNIVDYGTMEHWALLRDADCFFTSHCDDIALYPWTQNLPSLLEEVSKIKVLYKLVFLQHGVIRSNLSGWLGTKNFHKIICSSKFERNSLLDISNYKITSDEIALTGLARFDNLENLKLKTKIITIFPTWRKGNTRSTGTKEQRIEKFKSSKFYKRWEEFLNNDNILKHLKQNNIKVRFLLHSDNNEFKEVFKENIPNVIELIGYDEVESFSEIVNTSAALITDYSSFSFDFLYLKKPVIYYDFDMNALNNNLIEMDYRNFGYYCTKLEDVVEAFEKVMKNNFEMDQDFYDKVDELFEYRDKDNCKRIIESIQ